MRQLTTNWTGVIAEVSGDEQFQNATVRIFDPTGVTYGDYDYDTGERTITGTGNLYTGQARVMPMRWGVNRENNDYGNSNTWTAVLVQLPKNAYGRLNRGARMEVVSCTDNPVLETFMYSLTSDLQGSNAATRTLEFAVDGDSDDS